MVFVGHHSGLAQQREQSASLNLFHVLRLLGFLRWTSWAAGRLADVGTAGRLLHPSRILGSDRWFWRSS